MRLCPHCPFSIYDSAKPSILEVRISPLLRDVANFIPNRKTANFPPHGCRCPAVLFPHESMARGCYEMRTVIKSNANCLLVNFAPSLYHPCKHLSRRPLAPGRVLVYGNDLLSWLAVSNTNPSQISSQHLGFGVQAEPTLPGLQQHDLDGETFIFQLLNDIVENALPAPEAKAEDAVIGGDVVVAGQVVLKGDGAHRALVLNPPLKRLGQLLIVEHGIALAVLAVERLHVRVYAINLFNRVLNRHPAVLGFEAGELFEHDSRGVHQTSASMYSISGTWTRSGIAMPVEAGNCAGRRTSCISIRNSSMDCNSAGSPSFSPAPTFAVWFN